MTMRSTRSRKATSKPQAGSFPLREDPQAAEPLPLQFGNAVANAVDLFRNLDKDFPSWNLDGDRGLAYVTWQFAGSYDPNAVAIEPGVIATR